MALPGLRAQPEKGFRVAHLCAQAAQSVHVSEWNMVCPDPWGRHPLLPAWPSSA
jgi:hypothetical protein